MSKVPTNILEYIDNPLNDISFVVHKKYDFMYSVGEIKYPPTHTFCLYIS